LGTYIHGIFDTPRITRQWLARIGLSDLDVTALHGLAARDQAYDQLAAHVLQYLDLAAIEGLIKPFP
jgi:adenosylcobyric acid synthase